jgi:hypothetical protein
VLVVDIAIAVVDISAFICMTGGYFPSVMVDVVVDPYS